MERTNISVRVSYECGRDHVYSVHRRFIAYPFSTHHGETRLSRNELRRGRRKRGPYEYRRINIGGLLQLLLRLKRSICIMFYQCDTV